eukprot:scaffold6413_cov121-Isochrysis_galbana.AAC.6
MLEVDDWPRDAHQSDEEDGGLLGGSPHFRDPVWVVAASEVVLQGAAAALLLVLHQPSSVHRRPDEVMEDSPRPGPAALHILQDGGKRGAVLWSVVGDQEVGLGLDELIVGDRVQVALAQRLCRRKKIRLADSGGLQFYCSLHTAAFHGSEIVCVHTVFTVARTTGTW